MVLVSYGSFSSFDVTAYIDGSYNPKRHQYSYGVVLLIKDDIIAELSGVDDKYADMRNVAGEILASLKAIEWAITNKYNSIEIVYDYAGVQKWADGEWKANKEGTQEYKKLVSKYRELMYIKFSKVKAHSGDLYNDIADKLALEAFNKG